MKPMSAILLAGGKSARMGRDKAFLPWGESTFLGEIINAVLPLTGEIYLSGDDMRLQDFGFPVIPDVRENEGPVVALASCFAHIKTDTVLVLSCDVPQIKTQDLELLINAHHSRVDVTMFRYEKREMPLVALYHKSSFSAFAEALKSGERKLFAVLKNVKSQSVLYEGKEGLMNVNTREDVVEISQRTQRKNAEFR